LAQQVLLSLLILEEALMALLLRCLNMLLLLLVESPMLALMLPLLRMLTHVMLSLVPCMAVNPCQLLHSSAWTGRG
jgi:hypothetical protein